MPTPHTLVRLSATSLDPADGCAWTCSCRVTGHAPTAEGAVAGHRAHADGSNDTVSLRALASAAAERRDR